MGVRHRGDIQGLRALAVLLVVLGHAGVGGLQGGFVGVDVFFVVSGFLITGILLSQAFETGTISFVDFYIRRARRILPAAALTLLTTEVAAYFLLNFVRAREAVWDSLYAAAFASNFRFAAQGLDYFERDQPPSPLLHFWSLAVEEQFYLVWPTLISVALFGVGITRRRRHVGKWQNQRLLLFVIVIASASFGWSIHLTKELPPAAYFSSFTRAWELALGAALAVGASTLARIPPRWRLAMGWSGLLAVVLASVTFSDATPFPGYAALLPTVGTALMICAGLSGRQSRFAVARMLDVAPMRYVGDRSYAFYLWHWPVLIIAAQYAGYELPVSVNLLLVVGAFLLSIVSYAFVENPIRRVRWSVPRSGFAFGTAIAAVLVAAALSLAGLDEKEQRFNAPAPFQRAVTVALVAEPVTLTTRDAQPPAALSEVVAAVRAARRGDRIPPGLVPPIGELRNERLPYSLPRGCVPVAASSESSSKICPVGKTAASRTLVLIGDSHAQMWMPTLLRTAERDGWRVIPLLRPGCSPDTWLANRGLAACRPWYRWATRQVRLLHPNVTLVGGAVSGFRGAASRDAQNGMVFMAEALKPVSGRVVVIGDPQGVKRSPLDCLLARNASMALCTTTWSRLQIRPYDNIATRVRRMGVGFLDTRPWFCLGPVCPTVIGNTIAYKDPHHITVAYSVRLAAVFRTALNVS